MNTSVKLFLMLAASFVLDMAHVPMKVPAQHLTDVADVFADETWIFVGDVEYLGEAERVTCWVHSNGKNWRLQWERGWDAFLVDTPRQRDGGRWHQAMTDALREVEE